MNRFARVLFNVRARDAESSETPFGGPSAFVALAGQNFDRAALRKGAVILRDLIALRQIGIKIIFPREDRFGVDLKIKSESRLARHLHGLAVEHRQRAWQAQADRTGVAVRLPPEFGRTGTEDFRLGFELRVDFKADYGFPTFLHCFSPYSFAISPNVEREIITRVSLMKTELALAEESLDCVTRLSMASRRQAYAPQQICKPLV